METAVSTAQENNRAVKEQVSAQVARANRLNVGMAIVVMVSMIGAMVFSFLGVARPMTRLNGALGEMAGGNLDVVIPGASRGDEIGDLAKTVHCDPRKRRAEGPRRRRKPRSRRIRSPPSSARPR